MSNVINQDRESKTEKQALYGGEGDEIPASGKELPDRCEGKGCREKRGGSNIQNGIEEGHIGPGRAQLNSSRLQPPRTGRHVTWYTRAHVSVYPATSIIKARIFEDVRSTFLQNVL